MKKYKLTDKTKVSYSEDKQTAYIWAVKKETNKLEICFFCNPFTIPAIKSNGLKFAIEGRLLQVYKGESK